MHHIMKINISLPCAISLILLLFTGCVKNEHIVADEQINDTNLKIVPIEDALMKLEEFLFEVKIQNTKDNKGISYSSIEPYFGQSTITKSGSAIPEAYLVNFANEEGFAILGANEDITPIIAVVEGGNTTWEEIMSPNVCLDSELPENLLERELIGPGIAPEILLSMCVKGALYGQDDDETIETKSTYMTTILPLLGEDYNYGQHRTYCHKNNNKFVSCGCCSVAVSILLTYFKTSRMVIDRELISFNHFNVKDGEGISYCFPDGKYVYVRPADYFINSSVIPTTLNDSQMLELLTKIDPDVIDSHGTPTIVAVENFYRTRYKVSSAVYYTLNNIINQWKATGTMPNALINGLEDLKFTNVDKISEKNMTANQINTIIDMLADNEPVIMCGWSLGELSNSHYWVVDGIKHNDSETILHCNWGWGGASNGWFASDCIRSDSPVTRSSASNNNEWNNLIVFTYDKPSPSASTYFTTFYDEHRVTY